MFVSYYNKNKKDMFPHVKDWTLPPERHIAHKTCVKDLTWGEWFFFHNTAYTLLSFSAPIVSLLIFGSLALLCLLYWKSMFLFFLFAFLTLTQIIGLNKKIHEHKYCKGRMTFYDIWMKEKKPYKLKEEEQ